MASEMDKSKLLESSLAVEVTCEALEHVTGGQLDNSSSESGPDTTALYSQIIHMFYKDCD